jgi:hypothetical protein
MARYIAKYLGLPRSAVDSLINSITPKQPANIIFPALSDDERRRPKEKAQSAASSDDTPKTPTPKRSPVIEE